jgi:type III pantothenate kinase
VLLALDIGNSNIKIGAFREEDLVGTWRIATDARRLPDEYAALLFALFQIAGLDPSQVRGVTLCSVVPPLTTVFDQLSRAHLHVDPLVVGADVNTGLRIRYDPPRDVGTDRIAAASAAYHFYGGPVITVEVGTTTVFDAVTRDGDYLGGAIHPGLQVAAETLFTTTSQLRRVEMVRPPRAIGRNTIEAIQSGIILGHVGLVEEMIRRFREELGPDARVVGTGGLVYLVAQEPDVFDVVNEHLILQGLRLIHQMNRGG